MRAVIQKVLHASVVVDGRTVSSIGRGLMVLVGIGTDDTAADATQLIKKILNVRLFEDESEQMWKKSVMDIQGEVLCVSQFTLLAKIDKGSKPDFHGAMSSTQSKAMYADFLQEMGKAYDSARIKDGEFGAMMRVSLCNDGPVTITYDTKAKAASSAATPAASGRATPVDASEKAAQSQEDAQEKARRKREAKQEATKAFLARKAEQQARAPPAGS